MKSGAAPSVRRETRLEVWGTSEKSGPFPSGSARFGSTSPLSGVAAETEEAVQGGSGVRIGSAEKSGVRVASVGVGTVWGSSGIGLSRTGLNCRR